MKKFVIFITFVLTCLFAVQATNYTTYTFNLFKFFNNQTEHKKGTDNGGRRTPSIPIFCTLSEVEGITVDIDEADILAYEIWDAEGSACVASFVEGSDAATHLLSTPGEYQLRIITNDYVYFGTISL